MASSPLQLNRHLHPFALAVLVIGVSMTNPCGLIAGTPPSERISLADSVVLVDSNEASYVRYAAEDLQGYLTKVSGGPVALSSSPNSSRKARTVIAIGEKMALAMGADLKSASELGEEGSVIQSFDRGASKVVVVAGSNPHGTNMGMATLMQLIRLDGNSAYLEGPLDVRNQPSTPVRGLHLNGGWQLNHPYGFRTWTEGDWKRFVDIVWAQRGNLVFIWPYVETMTVPLSSADEAYLQEFRRITEYAQQERGMEVWIMQAANRVAVSECGVVDPTLRPHWINGCQKDMDPADPAQFAKIEKSFEALYRTVNNAYGFCLIDSDPGGWPASPISDQVKIFRAARSELLDRATTFTPKERNWRTWMWIGWGRHKFFTLH